MKTFRRDFAMRNVLKTFALLFLVFAPGTAWAQVSSGGVNSPAHAGKPYLIVVSFDGLRPDYLDRVETPNFDRVMAAGARAEGLIPVFPTKTFPNHYSIATGMYAERHGIVDNRFHDPAFGASFELGDRSAVEDGRWYDGEPIWVTAERQGMVAAAYFFVGTEAPIGGVRPTHYRRYRGSVANPARVDTVLRWLREPEERRPHLVMLYFSTVDAAGHRHGPDAPEVDDAVRSVDTVLGRLLDGIAELPIADRVHLVLVSDHGMIGVDPKRAEFLDRVADLDGVETMSSGPYTVLWIEERARLDAVVAQLREGLEHASVYPREEIPERFRYAGHRRAGDVLVLAEPGWQVGVRGRASRGGAHGYDPREPRMHGIFIASGPMIRPGVRIEAFENVHIYPFLAHILGLRPNPAIDGRLDVLLPILR